MRHVQYRSRYATVRPFSLSLACGLFCLVVLLPFLSGCSALEALSPKIEVLASNPIEQVQSLRDVSNDRPMDDRDIAEQAALESEKRASEEAERREAYRALEAETVLTDADVQAFGVDECFFVSELSDELFESMQGLTYTADTPVTRDELRYIRVLHKDADGQVKVGELVAHRDIAQELCDIFRELYDAGYPIERMRLADYYGAVDEQSMTANNTSAFCCRPVESTGEQSYHSYGTAVDINPLYNPYVDVAGGVVLPAAGAPYADRAIETAYRIEAYDACWQAFTSRGYTWGGSWSGIMDYQHFEKSPRSMA